MLDVWLLTGLSPLQAKTGITNLKPDALGRLLVGRFLAVENPIKLNTPLHISDVQQHVIPLPGRQQTSIGLDEIGGHGRRHQSVRSREKLNLYAIGVREDAPKSTAT